MNVSKCDFCGEYIKGKTQYIIEISSCDNGTSNNSGGPDNQENILFDDLCKKCLNKIKKLKKK